MYDNEDLVDELAVELPNQPFYVTELAEFSTV